MPPNISSADSAETRSSASSWRPANSSCGSRGVRGRGLGPGGGAWRYLGAGAQRLQPVVVAEVQRQREEAEQQRVAAELQEEPVVVLAHAVVDPGHTPGVTPVCVWVCV